MKIDNSELNRQERKLRNIRWYQILMAFFLIIALIFIILWAITFTQLKAQEKLRGDFNEISLVIKITRKKEKEPGEGQEVIAQEAAFKLYDGPILSKNYYGKTLASFLRNFEAFQVQSGFLERISLPTGESIKINHILSYSERNVRNDHSVKIGIDQLLLDRVNIFVFQSWI